MSFIRHIISNIRSITSNHNRLEKEIEELKLLTAKNILLNHSAVNSLADAEFKVFSQWGDDGIIQYLIRHIAIANPYFVEFGVENYTEANTRFLLMNNNWSGLILDGSSENMEYVKRDSIYWKYDLTARQQFVTAENINGVLSEEQVPDEIGLLHIDIDGNDYWIWKNINVKADIVIVEYNSLFGPERPITIPYQKDFVRTKAHHSNLYYGTSLLSLCDLAMEKGYAFVGCNSAGNNAYFVRNEKLGSLKPLSAEEGFVMSKFKEGRDNNGNLTFFRAGQRQEQIKGLKVYNTRTKNEEVL